MVPAGFRREFAAFFDKGAKLRLATFELAGFIVGGDPVCDFVCLMVVSSLGSTPLYCELRTMFAWVVEKSLLVCLDNLPELKCAATCRVRASIK
jgi:hypothetical protein